QQRGEILIRFLRRRQVFLKISFLNTRQLVFFATLEFVAFAIHSSAAKRRDSNLPFASPSSISKISFLSARRLCLSSPPLNFCFRNPLVSSKEARF
ncbi:hypothetical protein, partial [Roseateles sp.]|uniref:hypothetical protein n=1 Tax=Roseateles sp. TaxID=1971397 RepID=UPI0025F0E0AE